MAVRKKIKKRVILDLCGGSGEWSRPYRESPLYEVIVVDIRYGGDVRLWPSKPSDEARGFLEYADVRGMSKIHGVLAAPMCTVFCVASASRKRTDEEIIEGLGLVDACMRIIQVVEPEFWCLENPIGKLSKWIGHPKYIFQPYEFGDPYTKRTCLWGEFNIPKKTPVTPTKGSIMKYSKGSRKDRPMNRSITPAGFAKAFYKANP